MDFEYEQAREQIDAEQKFKALEPVIEAGGGESEGFEEAERRLVLNAELTGESRDHDPFDRIARDALEVDDEAARATAEYGDADHVESSEVDGS